MPPKLLHLANPYPYLLQQLQFMRIQEVSHYQCADYLLPSWATVTPSDRRKVCSWSYDIVDKCAIDREIACIGMSYLDRFMSTSSPRAKIALVSHHEVQLAFVTCLLIAMKCRGGIEVNFDFTAKVCQGLYDREEIEEMEKVILAALQWRLNGPSPHEFISALIELLPSCARSKPNLVSRLTSLSKLQAETAMLDYSIAIRSSSSIAYAALLNTTENTNSDIFHPLDRLVWMRNIFLATGMKTIDVGKRSLVTCDQVQLLLAPTLSPSDDNISYSSVGSTNENNYWDQVPSASSSIQTQECDSDDDELYIGMSNHVHW